MRCIETFVHLLHSMIIWAICNRIVSNQHCTISILILELFLTLSSAYLSKSQRRYIMLQVILSLALSSNLIMYKWYRLCWLYFIKTIHMYRIFNKIRYYSFINCFKYFVPIFDIFWSTVLFYLFLKTIGLVYCSFFFQQSCPIGYQYIILYQFMVTGSSVGYGDHVPTSKQQIYFIIFSIPVLCTSFSLYISKLIEVHTNLYNYCEDQDQDQHFT